MKKILISLGIMTMPVLVFAATLGDVLSTVGGLLNTVVTLLITLAIIYFIWGVIKYITADGDEKRGEGRAIMIHGIIAIFVIVAIWGLVGVLSDTFDIGTGGSAIVPDTPQI